MIYSLSDIPDKTTVFPDDNKSFGDINVYSLDNVRLTGKSLMFPNTLLYSNSKLYNPSNQVVQSLKSANLIENYEYNEKDIKTIYSLPLFYFIYNTDNYYHFVYDTLPYLISFMVLKKENPDLKLLMNYTISKPTEFYKFVTEFLELLDIDKKDIIIANENVLYSKIFISSSYSYGNSLDGSPTWQIYSIYKLINTRIIVGVSNKELESYPKKIYVSRRSWIHGDTSNIGTNYTTRRKLENEDEDELIDLLKLYGYQEVFTETLSTRDKILMFYNADSVIGAIGGGLVNVLFSKPTCNLICLVSPTFLDVNGRFIHSFKNVNTTYFTDTAHVESGEYKKYMRVQCWQNAAIVGEIKEVFDDTLLILYSDQTLAGWNSDVIYKETIVEKDKCVKLDNGLNSAWKLDIDKLKQIL